MLPMTAGEIAFLQDATPFTFHDQCQRLVYTEHVTADGRKGKTTYEPGATMPCRFRWSSGVGSDQTREANDLVTTAPMIHVPLGTIITSRDRVKLTHRYGQPLDPPLVFSVSGDPLPGLTSTRIELSRITT